jgi:hypothetical protein
MAASDATLDAGMFVDVNEFDVARPKRGLTALLLVASIAVWTFTLVASAQALV